MPLRNIASVGWPGSEVVDTKGSSKLVNMAKPCAVCTIFRRYKIERVLFITGNGKFIGEKDYKKKRTRNERWARRNNQRNEREPNYKFKTKSNGYPTKLQGKLIRRINKAKQGNQTNTYKWSLTKVLEATPNRTLIKAEGKRLAHTHNLAQLGAHTKARE